ncbi:hypothetical protein BDF19DRAFT_315398 [Syncephalis fuscata]|nr:hypothetical protein BDF19DRAFT_315398 [Syncephalis fuscata]
MSRLVSHMPLYLSLLSGWRIMSLSGSCHSLFSHLPRLFSFAYTCLTRLLIRFVSPAPPVGISRSSRHSCSSRSSEYSDQSLGQALQAAPNSSRFAELDIDKITNPNQSNDIANLRKTLITDVAFRNKLDGIASSDLKVYNNDEDATNQREPIEEDTPLSELIETGKGDRKRTP